MQHIERDLRQPLLPDSEIGADNVPFKGRSRQVLFTDEEVSQPVVTEADDCSFKFSWRKLWAFTGPGFLMSIAYLDPGNIESDLQAGAQTGYTLLWLLFWSTVIGLFVQLLAARLGVATGHNLAELCRLEYAKPTRIALWLMAELAIVGSDIQEVIGSAIAIRLLSFGTIPLWVGVLITAVDSFLFLSLESFGIRKLELLFAFFITVMAASFFRMFAVASPDLVAMTKGLVVPWVTRQSLQQAVGIIGAVIMPHNLFLHSALVQSRNIDTTKHVLVREALMYFSIESTVALGVSLLINLAIMAVAAATFSGKPEAATVGLNNAGMLLDKAYSAFEGVPMSIVWGLGLLAAGQSSTMTGTYAGQYVMSGFLNLDMARWLRILLTRGMAIIPTVVVALSFDQRGQALDSMNEWLNALQSVQLPFALVPLLCLVSDRRLMGEFTIGPAAQVLAWAVASFIIAVNFYLLSSSVFSSLPRTIVVLSAVALVTTTYVSFVLHLIWGRQRTHTPPPHAHADVLCSRSSHRLHCNLEEDGDDTNENGAQVLNDVTPNLSQVH